MQCRRRYFLLRGLLLLQLANLVVSAVAECATGRRDDQCCIPMMHSWHQLLLLCPAAVLHSPFVRPMLPPSAPCPLFLSLALMSRLPIRQFHRIQCGRHVDDGTLTRRSNQCSLAVFASGLGVRSSIPAKLAQRRFGRTPQPASMDVGTRLIPSLRCWLRAQEAPLRLAPAWCSRRSARLLVLKNSLLHLRGMSSSAGISTTANAVIRRFK